MTQPLTPAAMSIMDDAAQIAHDHGHPEISTGHLLLAIAQGSTPLATVLAGAGATADRIANRLWARTVPVTTTATPVEAAEVATVRGSAANLARHAGAPLVDTEHLLLATLDGQNNAQRILGDLEIDVDSLIETLRASISTQVQRNVFVVHGRDEQARQAVFDFLRALDLVPMEWAHLIDGTAPTIAETVAHAFDKVQATLVLMTPDDVSRLNRGLWEHGEPPAETSLTGQARPNVHFEAGMSMIRMPERTIFVEIGRLRPFTDIAGRSVVRLSPDRVETQQKLQTIAARLKGAGCRLNDTGKDWLRPDRFTDLAAHHRQPPRHRFGHDR